MSEGREADSGRVMPNSRSEKKQPHSAIAFPTIQGFLMAFDNYVAARELLNKQPEGSDEERLCIAACADSWARLVSARASLPSASTD